jgi:hypothetical protein
MNQPPPPRVQPLPIAQLINKLPGSPKIGESAYDRQFDPEDKGGLPMEIVAFAQSMYVPPQIPPSGKQGSSLSPLPGWGGQGR